MPGKPPEKFEKPYLPKLCPTGIELLGNLAQDADVLEVGSGESTLFFAERAKSVYSLEHDQNWANVLQAAIDKEGFDNVRLVVVDVEELGSRVRYSRNDSFDLVLIDCYQYQRREALERAISKVRVHGSLVADDAHFPQLRDIDDLFDENWEMHVIDGQKKHPMTGKIVPSHIKVFLRLA